MATAFFRFARTSARPGGAAGFTLLEMMVVVALAAIMLGLGLPSFRDLIVGQRVKTAAFGFANAAVYARSEAIKRGTEVVLVAAAGGWQDGWSVKVGSVTLSQQDGFAGLLIASPAPKVTPTQVAYQASGRLSASVDDLQLSDEAGAHARCISFDLSGLPKSRLGNCP